MFCLPSPTYHGGRRWSMKDIQKALGQKLRAIRKAKGLTQEQVADKGGMNFKYYGAIERGEINVTLKTVSNLARILNVRMGDLFSFDLSAHDKDKAEVIARMAQLMKKGSKDQVKRMNVFLKEVFR